MYVKGQMTTDEPCETQDVWVSSCTPLHHHEPQYYLSHVHTESSNNQHGRLFALVARHGSMREGTVSGRESGNGIQCAAFF